MMSPFVLLRVNTLNPLKGRFGYRPCTIFRLKEDNLSEPLGQLPNYRVIYHSFNHLRLQWKQAQQYHIL